MPPKPEAVSLTQADLDWLEKLAADRERNRGYASRGDAWGKGLVASPTLVGLVGEHALATYLTAQLGTEIRIDAEDRPTGDGGCDLKVFGSVIQVKTRLKRADLLIRRETEQGRLLPIHWNWCVCATWEREASPLTVALDGCIRGRNLLGRSQFVDGRRGNWKNLEVPDEELERICTMVYALHVGREMRGLP